MKQWFLVAVAAISCAITEAGEPEKIDTLIAKVTLENTNGYFVLADGSCWKAIGFSPRWRSLSEWWNNVELVPQHYECVPNDWFLGAQIDVYPKYGNLSVKESNASNQDALKQCTHLLVNHRTGQVLFAISLHPADCITFLFQDAQEDGYNKGYAKGRLSGYQNTNEVYDEGRAAGYKTGYGEGYQAAVRGEEQPGL